MASLNKVMLIGNLTRDPELRYTPKGQAVLDVGLAMNRKYKVENEMREEVTFADITFWGRGAEIVAQYMKKGNPMYVEGRLQLDSWTDQASGKKQSRLRIVAEEFQFLGGGNREGAGGGGGGGGGGGYSGGNSGGGGGGYNSGGGGGGGYNSGGGGYNSGGGGSSYDDGGGYGGGNDGGSRGPQQSRPPQQRQSGPPAPPRDSAAFPPALDDEDEIPF